MADARLRGVKRLIKSNENVLTQGYNHGRFPSDSETVLVLLGCCTSQHAKP